mgnify:CR=1 FL=1
MFTWQRSWKKAEFAFEVQVNAFGLSQESCHTTMTMPIVHLALFLLEHLAQHLFVSASGLKACEVTSLISM